jgi:hypothetical protein
MKKLNRWYRRRRFITAYKILRNESERHVAAGHSMRFEAVNEAYIIMLCIDCQELLP